MTREEAIKYFEKQAAGIEYTLEHSKACRMAAEALRAQQDPAKLDRSRWEGCKYCDQTLKKYPWINASGVMDRSIIYQTPKYCPICGKPLTEEAWEETAQKILCGGILPSEYENAIENLKVALYDKDQEIKKLKAELERRMRGES